jgi:hypothetical protein
MSLPQFDVQGSLFESLGRKGDQKGFWVSLITFT